MDKSPFVDKGTRRADHRHRLCSEHERNHDRAGHMPGTCGTHVPRRPARSGPLPQPLLERSRGSPVPLRRGANPRAYGVGIRRRQSLAGPQGRETIKGRNLRAMSGRDPGHVAAPSGQRRKSTAERPSRGCRHTAECMMCRSGACYGLGTSSISTEKRLGILIGGVNGWGQLRRRTMARRDAWHPCHTFPINQNSYRTSSHFASSQPHHRSTTGAPATSTATRRVSNLPPSRPPATEPRLCKGNH